MDPFREAACSGSPAAAARGNRGGPDGPCSSELPTPDRRGAAAARFQVTEGDATLGEVVRGQFQRHTVSRQDADVVLDCSDNFATRYALNRLCFEHQKPLVSGAAIGFEGQVTVYDFRHPNSPCYHCLFPDDGSEAEMRCSENGVFSPLVGMIGTTQAAEAMKLLMNIGNSLQGRLMLLDALNMEWRTIKLSKDTACKVCAG